MKAVATKVDDTAHGKKVLAEIEHARAIQKHARQASTVEKKKFKLSPELVSALHDQLLEVVPKSDANAAWSMLQPILEETPDLDTLHELMVQSFQGHEAEA